MIQDRNTPFTARSVLASSLLGSDPPELAVAQLVHLVGLFGINENRARVALSRMVASGEATTDGSGTYRLAGHLLDRRQRQATSRAGRTRAWSGEWALAVITTAGSTADVRNHRRRSLAFARLAELREGTWLRPDNIEVVVPADVGVDLVRMTARPHDGHRLASRLWDLGQWSDRAVDLLGRLGRLPPSDGTDLAPGFELSAAVLRHFQADPLLPSELLPADWPGDELRRVYDEWDARYREVLAAWSRAV